MVNHKPALLAQLQKGKLIDTVKGVVATFNWMVSCWDNLSTGMGLRLTKVGDGKPLINLALSAGTGIKIAAPQGANQFSKTLEISADTLPVKGGEDTNLTAETKTDEDGEKYLEINVYYL